MKDTKLLKRDKNRFNRYVKKQCNLIKKQLKEIRENPSIPNVSGWFIKRKTKYDCQMEVMERWKQLGREILEFRKLTTKPL